MKKIVALSLLICVLQVFTVQLALAQPFVFKHTYGNMPFNYGQKIIESKDRGYYILSNVSALSGNNTIDIIRTDSLGIIIDNKIIGAGPVYWANDFIRTSDRGFLICGITNKYPANGYDMLLIKTDSSLNHEWEKTYGGADWDIAQSVRETFDNAYLMVGKTYSYGPSNDNVYVVKTDLQGDTLWTRTFGGDSSDYATSVDILFDSTYLIGGATNSFGYGNYDGYVINLGRNGDTIWTRTYGEDKEDIIYSIKQTPDSGFVFVGSTMSYNAIQHENWLMRFDKNHQYWWRLPEFWDIGPGDDMAYDVFIDDSARYVLTGYTTGVGMGGREVLMLVMGDGDVFLCSLTDGSANDETGNQVIQTADGGYVIVGSTQGIGPCLSNIYLLKTGNNCYFTQTPEHILAINEHGTALSEKVMYITPSLSDGKYDLIIHEPLFSENIMIMVYDIMGRLIVSENVKKAAMQPFRIDISGAADGLYFIEVLNKQNRSTFKVVKCGK
ncbi:MAG TPA: T9SS type A sorting domain-containing protein [Bacteroidales bacterium]|nr:T9SS type A sorting domain-containing protein [Bacteroidales bacterium]HPS27844.1 T9SS type A sorting domain-containing protein [Bacteroidales bacterium]